MSNTTPFGYPIPAARKVSPLRQCMIEDMTVRNFAPNTQESYLSQVSLFARHSVKSRNVRKPDLLEISLVADPGLSQGVTQRYVARKSSLNVT
jgi:hypothetical protein